MLNQLWLLMNNQLITKAVLLLCVQNVGSAEDIDKGMRLGTNQPMGPLRLADFIGGWRSGLSNGLDCTWKDVAAFGITNLTACMQGGVCIGCIRVQFECNECWWQVGGTC